MSSIIIAAVPIHGHVNPLLAVARHLVARGDRVRFITGARFAELVDATGATHIALPDAADFDDRLDIHEVFPGRVGLSGPKAIAFDLEHIFVAPARAQHDAVMAAHAAEPADVLLTDPMLAGGAYIVGHPRPRRPAVVMCGLIPLSMASPDVAPFGLGLAPAKVLNRTRNRVLTTLTRPVFRTASRIADDTNRELHGRALGYPIIDWARHADAVAQFTVPAFEYPRRDAPATLHFVGPISATGSHAPRPAWWEELDERPLVHVTQGTIANKDFGQLVAPTLEALADDDVLVAVTTGGRPLDTLPPLPANARAAEYLNYDELLPRTAVFVTNGGYGGVQYALRYGVPIVATGGKEDKPEVGARIEWSGVGRRIRSDQPGAKALQRAIREVLREPRFRDAGSRIAADLAAAPGFDGLTTIVDSFCHHAAAPARPGA